MIRSPHVDNIFSIQEEYPYFKQMVGSVVNLKTNEEVDYEDGPEEEQEEIKENAQQVTQESKNYQKTK